MNAILFKFFWFKVFVHWKLKLLNFPMHYDALTFLRLLWKLMIMNQTFYNLVEISRYERDLASRQCGIRECCFFEQRSSRSRKAKKTIWIFPPLNLPCRLDFRRLPGPVFDPPRRETLFRGMSAGSFSRTAAGNRAYLPCGIGMERNERGDW